MIETEDRTEISFIQKPPAVVNTEQHRYLCCSVFTTAGGLLLLYYFQEIDIRSIIKSFI